MIFLDFDFKIERACDVGTRKGLERVTCSIAIDRLRGEVPIADIPRPHQNLRMFSRLHCWAESNLARAIEGLIVAHQATKLALGAGPGSQFDPPITSTVFETSDIRLFHGSIRKLFCQRLLLYP